MDNYAYGAHGRIRVFLADLHYVLGSLPPSTPHGLAPNAVFNSISCQPDLAQYYDPHTQPSWKGPTRRSRAWKKNQSKIETARSPPIPSVKQTKLGSPPKGYTVQFPRGRQPANTYDRCNRHLDLYQHTTHRRPANIYDHIKRYRPEENFQRATQVQAKDQQVNFRYSDEQEPRSFEEPLDQSFHLELLDQQRDSAVNYPCDEVNDHLFSEPPIKKTTGEHHSGAHSDAEEDERLDQDESEWDDRSDLDIMADSDHFYPFLSPAAPINHEVNSIHSHHDGSQEDTAFDPTLTVGPISHEEAVSELIPLPIMPIEPELAAPSNDLYFVAPVRNPTLLLHDCHAPLPTETIDPVHTYLDRNIVPILLEDNFTYRQPNQSLDSLPNNNVPDYLNHSISDDHHEYGNHNIYNNDHNVDHK
ncbi:hypothetical protein Pst134EA_020710 [Puccinia striiformis f. sp. tritici]|uniref:Uncharacterized protein n=1 Tax=Puccinia striiformis f. sp. tritici PST-78 TaxID=1165861 RepID=A0A0L0VK92_9BASI|nr:hypothetical protein Pst134EA_020710 [Puccinia striiformis f. sp. tritici]KAH9456799.1 hypothetical protein Pst134EA_020710 [Puccinia striiformis f. sp. tritici]KNE99697.1 hypothetical protein PSTG_06988 [Puccinia striiformis f. sp. tritici PST-78]